MLATAILESVDVFVTGDKDFQFLILICRKLLRRQNFWWHIEKEIIKMYG